MGEYILKIHGIIGGTKTSKKDNNLYYSYNDFLLDLNNIKKGGYTSITLDIASEGGYCDVADLIIKGLLELGIEINSRNSGNVASAASKIFMLGNTRVFYPNFGLFLIHNPWAGTEGDANQHLEMAISLKETEMEYVKWYSSKTGVTEDIIEGLMSENIPLTNKQIEEFGFANIVQAQLQAFVKLNSDLENNNINNKESMENNVVIEKIGVIEKLLNKFIGDKKAILIVNDVNGKEITFPELSTIEDVEVGSKVEVEDGEYVMSNGDTIVVASKVVTEIKKEEIVEEETEVVEEEIALTEEETIMVDELKAENEALKLENEALKGEIETLKSTTEATASIVEEMAKEITSIKALASGTLIDTNVPEQIENKVERTFKYKSRK